MYRAKNLQLWSLEAKWEVPSTPMQQHLPYSYVREQVANHSFPSCHLIFEILTDSDSGKHALFKSLKFFAKFHPMLQHVIFVING